MFKYHTTSLNIQTICPFSFEYIKGKLFLGHKDNKNDCNYRTVMNNLCVILLYFPFPYFICKNIQCHEAYGLTLSSVIPVLIFSLNLAVSDNAKMYFLFDECRCRYIYENDSC